MAGKRTGMAQSRTNLAFEGTLLTNSQTLLAYIRTALAVFAAGVGMFEFTDKSKRKEWIQMTNETQFFMRKRVDRSKLKTYGFTEDNGIFCYRTKLPDGQFLMEVFINGGSIRTRLLDTENECEYTLHTVKGAQGEFVGAVRAAYEQVLSDIRDKCFIEDVFKSSDAKAIIQYVSDKYDTPLEFLWEKFPDNAIYRRKDNRKWYAAILTVAGNKIGLDRNDTIEILDLRIDPMQLTQTIDYKRYFPGYHMNKKSWYTICLDGSVDSSEIFERIDISYELAKKK